MSAIPYLAVLNWASTFVDRAEKILSRDLPDPKQHPAQYHLLRAYAFRLLTLANMLRLGKVDRAGKWGADCAELHSYIYGDNEEPTGEFADSLNDAGMRCNDVLAILNRINHKGKMGAPAAMRQRFIEGYDLQSNGLKYEEIAKRLCPLKGCKHTDTCQDSFRKGMKAIGKVLAKYPVPAPRK